jgi:ankyrin repeat protein
MVSKKILTANHYTELLHACANGDLQEVKYRLKIFKYDITISDFNHFGRDAVFAAARTGHMEVLKVLVVHFGDAFDVNQTNGFGETVVHLAYGDGHVNIVKYLLQQFKDFDINVSSFGDTYFGLGDTVLHMAARAGHVNIVKVMLEHYKDAIDVNKTNHNGDTFLHRAARNGHVNIVKVMLEHYKDAIDVKFVNKHNRAGYTAIYLATLFDSLPIVQVLLSNFGTNIDVNVRKKSSLLDIAISNGNRNIVELFFFKTSSPVKVSSFIYAIERKKYDLVKLIHGKIHKLFKDDIEIIDLFSRYFELSKEVLKKIPATSNNLQQLRIITIIIKKELRTKYGNVNVNVTLLTNDESEPIEEELHDVA